MALDSSVVEYPSQFHGAGALGSWSSPSALYFQSDLDIRVWTSAPSVSLHGASRIHYRHFKRAHFSSRGPSGVDSHSPE